MGFWDERPRPTEAERPQRPESPSSMHEPTCPPAGVLPGLLDVRLVLFHTNDVALIFDQFDIYPSGIALRHHLHIRQPTGRNLDRSVFRRSSWWVRGQAPPAKFLRLGVAFADGTAWSNIDFEPFQLERSSEQPKLESLGGGGGDGGSWTTYAWLSPRPPDGPLTIFAEWPAYGISETSETIEAGEIRRATQEIDVLWPQ